MQKRKSRCFELFSKLLGAIRARRANDSNVKEVEMTVTGKSAVQLGASSGGTPDLARGRGDRGDLEAAEGPPAFVDHLEVSRKGRWRGRCAISINYQFQGIPSSFSFLDAPFCMPCLAFSFLMPYDAP